MPSVNELVNRREERHMEAKMRDSKYHVDQDALEALGPRRQEFEAWMTALDEEVKKKGNPYGGEGDVWDQTGPLCWIDFFLDGYTPADALLEDMQD